MMKLFAALAVLLSGAAYAAAEPIKPTGRCDDRAINAAIDAQPEIGGRVELAPGTFQICRNTEQFGGVTIRGRSNFVLSGSGGGTILRLADGSDTNVIRIVGGSNVTIRDLACDGNRTANDHRSPEERFEVNCIRAGDQDDWPENVVVDNVHAYDCPSLCVMLFGRLPVVRNSFFGDADSDIVELLGEGGQIIDNRAVIRATTGFVFGGDAQSDLLISRNTVIVEPGGTVEQAVFRTYPGHRGTTLTGNVVRVEPGGWVKAVADLRSYFNIVGRNNFHLRRRESDNALTKMKFNGGSVVTGNVIQSAEVVLKDTSVEGWGAVFDVNVTSDVTMPDTGALRRIAPEMPAPD